MTPMETPTMNTTPQPTKLGQRIQDTRERLYRVYGISEGATDSQPKANPKP